MPSFKVIFVIAVVVLAGSCAWQIGACELANIELKDDMQDIAAQPGTRIGLSQMITDEDIRNAVLRKARSHDIDLAPEQISVQHMGSGALSTVYIEADYTVPVKLPGYTFTVRFTPKTGKKLLSWRTNG